MQSVRISLQIYGERESAFERNSITDCRDLSPEKLKQCLEFARDWNTNSRRCHAAQAMLQAIILEQSPQVWQACCPLLLITHTP